MRQQYPDSQVYVYYIDLRALGRNEDLLSAVQADPNVHLIKGKVARITEDPVRHDPIVEAEITASGKISRTMADLVVLATGMMPTTAQERPSGIQLNCDEDGFVLDAAGVYGAGCAKKPMEVSATVQDATSAALKAIQSAVRR